MHVAILTCMASFPFFGFLTAKEALSTFNGSRHVRAQDGSKFAAAHEHGGKKSGTLSPGVPFMLALGVNLDAAVRCPVRRHGAQESLSPGQGWGGADVRELDHRGVRNPNLVHA